MILLAFSLFISVNTQAEPTVGTNTPIKTWLQKGYQASRQLAYTGTYVVRAGGQMASAKIWHVCDGEQQMERVESLTGAPRSTIRRDDQVITFYPTIKLAVLEKRDSLGLFPGLLKSKDTDIDSFYELKSYPNERVAGLQADVVGLTPKDALRFGYRVWSEKRTGLIVQLQTVTTEGQVIEQSAFSELSLNAPVSMHNLGQLMRATEGYRVERPELHKANPDEEGWALKQTVAGFKPTGCFQWPNAASQASYSRHDGSMQWTFSDGLATVSLFVEAFDVRRHVRQGPTDLGGATHIYARRVNEWWITAVGEVPASTVKAFALALERKQ
ncbi:MucB/RseB C-terminal domain-containing protein [Rhodoferax aquaticus]|uniref:MucB/RseB C-terminal domain-containing protein n=1 Tax=Rhodoferax aquaticus TaxID=2527691 RepID=UPI00143D98EB|nr:MucB/RseB C-terminal domain-containing protein [Rhodoferax aquaticus]